MANGTIYFWSMILESGKMLTIYSHKPFSPSLNDQIREEVGGDFIDAKVETVETHRFQASQENFHV